MIILGLGSNIADENGDPIGYLRKAIRLLKSRSTSPGIEVVCISAIYESDALLPDGAPETWNHPYFNLCVSCETDLDPRALLSAVKKVERLVGRQDRGRWAPREIDIDILAYDTLQFESAELKIPHPALLERPFAMLPLADIAPRWRIEQKGAHFGKSAIEYVSDWKKRSKGRLPFNTRRSSHFLTELVGILNLTPDSFSDGGMFHSTDTSLEQTQTLLKEGSRIIDIGAESTGPGASPLPPEAEWKRLAPVLSNLKSHLSTPFTLSIDTRNPFVAEQAIRAGAHWINDVSGLSHPKMQEIALQSKVDFVVMHSLTVPADRKTVLPEDCDPVQFILEWAENRIHDLTQLGISRDRIILDPGLGFGKTQEQSWAILRGACQFQELGIRILIGHSRKSFLSTISSLSASNRDIETLALTLDLAMKGIDYIRVHHAGINTRGLKTWAQVDGVIRCRP